MKKTFILFLSLFTMFFTLGFAKVNAADLDKSKLLAESNYVKQEMNPTILETLDGNVVLRKQKISTLRNGIETGNPDTEVWSNNTVSSLTMPADSSALRIVSWAAGTTTAWQEKTIIDTAKDFEARNPGWIVVGGVNGDGFQWKGLGGYPSGSHVQDGDTLNPTPSFSMGFGENNMPVVGWTSYTSMPVISVKKDGAYVKVADTTAINGAPTEDGAVIVTPWGAVISDQYGYPTKYELGGKTTTPIDVTGYTVYKCTIDYFRRVYDKDGNGIPTNYTYFFTRGKVEEILTGVTTLSGDKDHFYFVAKEGKLDLNVGDNVRCQYELTGQFAGVQNIIGRFGYTLLDNGNPQLKGENVSPAPRTALGFKPDGSAVMIVVDGRGSDVNYTASIGLFEAGELLRMHGCTHGYNLDGGGSATLIRRTESGGFQVINTPSDGSVRSVGNALLIVMRDPGVKITNLSGDSITISQTKQIVDGTISNFKVTVNDKVAVADENGNAVIEGLMKNVHYTAHYTYDITDTDGTVRKGYGTKEFTTLSYTDPKITDFTVNDKKKDDGIISITYSMRDSDKVIKRAYIQYGENIYSLSDVTGEKTRYSGDVKLEDLDLSKDTEFKLVLEVGDISNLRIVESEVYVVKGAGSTFTVSFDTDGGTTKADQKVADGELAKKPTNPTKSGYTFKGWYLDGEEFDFDTPIHEDITLTAEWEAAAAGCSMGTSVVLPMVAGLLLTVLMLRKREN